jgi:NAD(P)-dependent dehydrogenase (short-subunit alcohol dehydrogenase family)
VLERAVSRRHLARHAAHGPPGQQDRGEDAGDWPVPSIGRVGQASDVAAAAVFSASDQAGFITGTTLLADGGVTAGYLQRERDGRDQ